MRAFELGCYQQRVLTHAEPSHGLPLTFVGKDMRPTGVRGEKSEQSSAFGTGAAAQLAVGDQWPQPWLFRRGWQWCAGAVCLEWLQWSMHRDVTVVAAFGVNATATGCVTVEMGIARVFTGSESGEVTVTS